MKGVNDRLRLDTLVSERQPFYGSVPVVLPLWQREKSLVIGGQEKHSFRKDWKLLVRYLSKYGKPYRRPALISGLCLVSFGFYEVGFSYALKVIVDGVSMGTGAMMVAPILLGLLVAFPIVALIVSAGERISARITSRCVKDFYDDMYIHLQRLPVSYYKHTKIGDILTRFSSDMIYVRLGVTEIISIAADAFIVLLNIAFLIFLSWQMALISLVSLPLLIYTVRDFTPPLSRANYDLKDGEALVLQAVQESVNSQTMVKSFSVQPYVHNSFLAQLDNLQDVTADSLFYRTTFERTIISSLLFSQLLSISAGVLLIGGGYITIGALLSFILLQGVSASYLRKLFRNRIDEVLTALVAVRRIDALLHNQIDREDPPHAIELTAFQNRIRFEKVSFGYADGQLQLKEVDFVINSGEFVAFVGPSDAGKSTILNLILRFYEATCGRITLDDHDVRDLTKDSMRAKMGVVLQDTFVFNASIFDNIRIVKPTATEEEVVAAAKAAELHDFISSLPEGYQTSAGEAGKRLSGGQKQRIAIARAILCNPAILILDEATSSLDAETASAVDATIHKLSKSCTVISISHNLRAVANADTIFVLDQGRIAETGRHEDLMAQNGLYTQLWRSQDRSR